IGHRKTVVTSVITILNYEKRQANSTANGTANGQQTDSRRTADGTGTKNGNNGKNDNNNSAHSKISFEEEFEKEFWPQSPIRIDKKNAQIEWVKARQKFSKEIILAGLPAYRAKEARRKRKDGENYQPHRPSQWLHDERWTDEVPVDPPKPRVRKAKSLLDDPNVEPDDPTDKILWRHRHDLDENGVPNKQ
ncbi:MAG: hypothetical protein U9Q07_02300, partial [Planctomycetota bacterium]|nr:hypothetical protein [Planctomycetota bacterium]